MRFRDLTPSLLPCVCPGTRVRRPDANIRSSSSASHRAFLRQELSWAWSLSIGWMDSKPQESSVSAFSVLGLHVRVPTPSFLREFFWLELRSLCLYGNALLTA